MNYIFGKLVTPAEEVFLNRILTETDRTAKIKHFKAIYCTAKRCNTTLQNASQIFDNNKILADKLNANTNEKTYFLNKDGEVCKLIKTKFGGSYSAKLSDDELKSLQDINYNKESKPVGRFANFTSKLKKGFSYLKEMLSVY